MGTQPAVVAVSGHMVDAPDRAAPRFPADQVPRVTAEVRGALEHWGVGAETTIVAGGARGADIVAAEQAAALGARVRLVLALGPDEFNQRSVALAGTDWSARFHRLLESASVEVLDGGAEKPPRAGSVFERANQRIVDLARSIGPDSPHALVVWDGRAGGEAGGTRDFVSRLGSISGSDRLRVIDPTRRAYEARQEPDGPKKLLALDGGGIRGALTIEILAAIESQLRRRYGPEMVLADYFDYVGGTSTGAIIAAAIAVGKTVNEIRQGYETFAGTAFQKRALPLQLRSRYRDGPLTDELNEQLGPGLTLGDPGLRCLLLLVLHNAITDSAWPISNCTKAKYNSANLLLSGDRNLDLPLTTLIRGSTAAPFYFPPQELRVGGNRFRFRDGGITPFSNPALLLVLMATVPEYGLCWPTGEDALLVVSVGTGAAAAVHRGRLARSGDAIFDARNLVGAVMNGASTGQDLVCRALGRTRAGAEIDSEYGSREGQPGIGGMSLFSYLRYNADLSDAELYGVGIRDRRLRQRVRKLDAVDAIPHLQAIGGRVGAAIDVERHFAGFL